MSTVTYAASNISNEASFSQTSSQVINVNVQQEESSIIFDRLGCPNTQISSARLMHVLHGQTGDLLNHLYDTFYLKNGQLFLIEDTLNATEQTENFIKKIILVYYTAKLAFLKSSSGGSYSGCSKRFEQFFDIFLMNFEELFRFYSLIETGETVSSDFSFNLLLVFGLLVSALSEFISDAAKNRIQPALVLIISSAPLAQLSEAFKIILPPAHQSRLFALTLYRDLQTIESKIELDDIEQVAKLKVIMEVALTRYGPHFLNYYSDEILNSLNEKDILHCSAVLWQKATQNGNAIQTGLGPSFLVNLIKYQWGIIKDSNGVVSDPTLEVILVYTDLTNLFEFLYDQAQPLFLLVTALNTVLTENSNVTSAFGKDSETLIVIYIELMDYLVRLSSALIDSYAVHSQSDVVPLIRSVQVNLKQSLKFYILLLTISLCSLQLTLAGPLQIPSAPPISPMLEFYISNSNFSASALLTKLDSDFCEAFSQSSTTIFSNYSMINNLSKKILNQLKGKIIISGVFGTGISCNWLCFSIFALIFCLVQFIWFVESFSSLISDFLLF